MRFRLFVFFNLVCIGLSAQTSPNLSGVVRNEEGQPIPYATISLLHINDSSFVSYVSSSSEGKYYLTSPYSGDFLVQARCLGYNIKTEKLTLRHNSSITVDFILTESTTNLNEVKIRGELTGMKINKDTIKYNPKAYVDGTETVLGDVLNKLPGIVVYENGNINAHGKQVEKLMLDGKDFFDGNAQMAVKNLPAEIADNVEVINNYSDYSLLSGFQSHEKTVMNIGVNKDWLGKISGTISLGGGIEDKYLMKGTVMQINPTVMTSVIGAMNNSGEKVFSIEDYIRIQGGLEAYTENKNSTGQLSEEEVALLMVDNNVLSRKAELLGFNLAFQPKNTFKLNSYLLFNNNRAEAENETKSTYFLPGNEEYSTSSTMNATKGSRLFNAYLKLDYQPKRSFNLSYRANASNMNLKDHSSEFIERINKQVTGMDNKTMKTLKTDQKLLLMQGVGKHLLMADLSFKYDNTPIINMIESDSLLLPVPLYPVNDIYYGEQKIKQYKLSGRLDLSFRYRINNLYFLRFAVNISTLKQSYNTDIYQSTPGDYNVLLSADTLRNRLDYAMNDYNAALLFVKNVGSLRFKIGTTAHIYTYGDLPNDKNKSTSYKLQPQAEFSVFFSPQHSFTLSYSEQDIPTSIDEFSMGIVIQSFRSYSRKSEMTDLYATKQEVSLSYLLINLYTKTTLSLSAKYSRFKDISAFNYFSDGLYTERRIISSIPKEQIFANMLFNKGLGFIPWRMQLSGSFFHHNYYAQTTGKDNKVKYWNGKSKFMIESLYRSAINAEVNTGIEYQENTASLKDSKSYQVIQRYGGKIKLAIAKYFRGNIALEYIINNSSESHREIYSLNAAFYYRFWKNKVEIGLEGMNMLNINKQDWTIVASGSFYTTEIILSQLPGNIMLRLNYRF
jgi:hypothetical protein